MSHQRTCLVKKKPDEQFEFNLKEEEARGQIITEVTPKGPADRSGLKIGDRIIAVNGTQVEDKPHGEVVAIIKKSMVTNEINFEVVDKEHDPKMPKEKTVEQPKKTEAATQKASDLRPRLCKITKWNGSFGFELEVQVNDGPAGHFVKTVKEDGPAASCGLKNGDRIIEVGGTNIEKVKYPKVAAKIQKSKNKVALLVVDEATFKHYRAKNIKIKAKNARLLSSSAAPSVKAVAKQSSSEPKEESTSDNPKARIVHVLKEGGKGYGFSLRINKGENGDYIRDVAKGSPGDVCGLMNGDRLIAVNGNLVMNKTHDETVAVVKTMANHVVFVVAGPKAIEQAAKDGLVSTLDGATEHLLEKPRKVKLHKGNSGFGFSLNQSTGKAKHIFASIANDSEAEKNGLKNGDVLSCVEGANVMNLDHKDCVTKIKEAGSDVNFIVGDAKTIGVLVDLEVDISSDFLDSWPEESNFVIPDVKEHDNFFKKSSSDSATEKNEENAGPSEETKSTSSGDNNGPLPRLCKLTKENNTFGFHLVQDDNGAPGHFIRNLVEGGSGAKAGLKEDDKVVEVNDENIDEKSHEDVVAMIKASGEKVELLVVDKEADLYYKKKEIKIVKTLIIAEAATEAKESLETPPEISILDAEISIHANADEPQDSDSTTDLSSPTAEEPAESNQKTPEENLVEDTVKEEIEAEEAAGEDIKEAVEEPDLEPVSEEDIKQTEDVITEETKEEVEERIRAEMKQKIEEEIRKKMEEEMEKKKEEIRKKMEEEMRMKIAAEYGVDPAPVSEKPQVAKAAVAAYSLNNNTRQRPSFKKFPAAPYVEHTPKTEDLSRTLSQLRKIRPVKENIEEEEKKEEPEVKSSVASARAMFESGNKKPYNKPSWQQNRSPVKKFGAPNGAPTFSQGGNTGGSAVRNSPFRILETTGSFK